MFIFLKRAVSIFCWDSLVCGNANKTIHSVKVPVSVRSMVYLIAVAIPKVSTVHLLIEGITMKKMWCNPTSTSMHHRLNQADGFPSPKGLLSPFAMP